MTVKKKDDQTKNERSKFISSKIMLGVSILLLVLFSAIAFRTFTSLGTCEYGNLYEQHPAENRLFL